MTAPAQPTPAKREDVGEELPGNSPAGTPGAAAPGSLRAAVLGVEGVTDVFPSRPLWQRLPAGALSLLQQAAGQQGAGDPDDGPLVEARADGRATDVTVRIGVGADARTPDVVRAVAAVVRNHFAPAEVSVKVTVARISPE
ncbi:hypothetical protein Achl_3266 [Pseudarthrobacter chlorophenolicus A6]|uniref:Uncharacterized protein n=1 Tax=Pseudarthrobacter chlorophenolicus (strain ATCC 700700 / DSM 12829 / CIP 107037 / JCM 12360 / KCTC 9906 / NCIMB 13794 / A6) TaxID=452863 RepID=B8HG34_PSECP|nr:hypothetical protein [Pseudarthrobacter chlorophenolicus]ACL41227.1 hypothetical protein Achl_3266 [Pseudarthrobacter chlorophenolicus A6]SDQ67977.1 hypothetical protein SAMN04489738_2214 [Pseudarthrobacter chlorophenolicus]